MKSTPVVEIARRSLARRQQRVLRFHDFPAVDARNRCLLCDNSGWRTLIVDGERRVTRCQCVKRRVVERNLAEQNPGEQRRQVTAVHDFKSAAAGERR